MLKRLLITGYKAHELGIFDQKHEGIHFIKKAIQKELIVRLDEGLEWVIVSGQYGVELWAAEVVLDLKDDFPHLKLAVITPFLNHEKNWKDEKQDFYNMVISMADFVDAVSKQDYVGPWQFKKTNEFLMNNSDGLLIVYDDENEGSPKFMLQDALLRHERDNYALFRITSYDLQAVVEEEQERLYWE